MRVQLGWLCGAAVLACSAMAGSDGAAPWPHFRGPNADGISPEQGLNKDWKAKPPKLLWSAPLAGAGFAGPSAADGKVLIVEHQGAQDIVKALNLATGQQVWQFGYAESTKSDQGGYHRATPVVSDGKVYTLSTGGQLHCLDLKSGAKVWVVNLIKDLQGQPPQWHYSMSVLVDGNALVVCPGAQSASVVTLNKATGQVLWKGGGSDGPGYATPLLATLARTKQYVVFALSSIMGVDAASGKQLWSIPWVNQWKVNAPMPIAIGDAVFFTSGYGRGCALADITPAGAKIRWENKEISSHFTSPILHQGLIYGTSDPGRLVCLDPQTGSVKWQQRGFGKGGLVGLDGAMVVMDDGAGDIVLVALNPQSYQELGRIRGALPPKVKLWSSPIIAEGKLLARDPSKLVCYDLR